MKKPIKLKAFRNELKLTQLKMAESIGVSLSMYEKVERGQIQASRNFMDSLKSKYPNVDVGEFFFD